MMNSKPVIRRCWRCGEAASVVVRDWGPSSAPFFAKNATQKDWVCQSCGRSFRTRHRWRRLIFGLPLIPILALAPLGGALTLLSEPSLGTLLFTGIVCLFSLVFFTVFIGPFVALVLSPVRPDAPMPPMRFKFVEPERRCTCGEGARCVQIVEQRTRGIKTGVDYHYSCAHCGKSFTIESIGGSLNTVIVGGLLSAGAGFALSYAASFSWLGIGIAVAVLLLGLGAIALTAGRVVNRIRHPRIQPDAGWEAAG